jgi:hypothetical protein
MFIHADSHPHYRKVDLFETGGLAGVLESSREHLPGVCISQVSYGYDGFTGYAPLDQLGDLRGKPRTLGEVIVHVDAVGTIVNDSLNNG